MIPILNFEQAMSRIRGRHGGGIPDSVPRILEDIRRQGDSAVREWAAKLDGFAGDSFEVPPKRLQQHLETLAPAIRRHLEEAARRIRQMATEQRRMFQDLTLSLDGVELGHRGIPHRRVACYAPGGRYPLPSSVLMGVIPARVAGVEEVVVLSPKLHPVTAAAASIAGADRVFDLGGAHGVAAAAYGLAGLPRVDLVVGPGNRYVTAAKRLLYGEVGIEFPAGPSELLIIADAEADAAVLASDLLAQAEHDPDAWPVLVSRDPSLLERTGREIARQLDRLPAGSPAGASIAASFMVRVDSLEQAAALSEALCPEHLELIGPDAESLAPRLHNFGALFLGPLAAEVVGDYGSGTNHILPTGGAARFAGGLWVGTFLKVGTWQRVSPAGLPALADMAAALAEAEGLPAHAASARARLPYSE